LCFVADKTCIANGGDRRQRSSSPSCIASSRVIGSHAAGVMLQKLVPATGSSSSGVTAVRKSACLGGQSLATSAAKRLLARPACRGGHMMPERPAQHCPVKKKPKPKRVSPKVVADENITDSKCIRDQKSLLRQPPPASAMQNTSVPVVPANARPSVTENVPSAPLPRIVIKIHQGKIVSPPTVVSSSASVVGIKKQTAEQHGSGDVQQSRCSDSVVQRTETSDRMKGQPPLKPAKPAVSSKVIPKNASHSTSSKVLADKNSNITCFDSSQLQDSGSYDKLSLDCCMKLYSQIKDPQKASRPSQSLSESSKKSKQASKHHRGSQCDRVVHAPESKKRSLDCTHRRSSVCEPLAKVRADGSSNNTVKLSASHPPNCRVELSRIKPSTDTRKVCHKVSDDAVKGNVSEKFAHGEEGRLHEHMHENFGAVGSDATNNCCLATLSSRSDTTLTDVTIQQNDVPTASETVPGLSTPLYKPSRSFSKKSHAPAENDSSVLISSYKYCATDRLDSFKKTLTSVSCGALNHSTNDCTIPAAKKVDELSGIVGGFEVPTDCLATKNLNIQHTKNSACELADSQVPDNQSSEASVCRKRCSSTEYNISSDDAICTAKQSRLSRLPCERLTELPLASGVVDEMPGSNPVSSLPSLPTASTASVAACEAPRFMELSSISEPLSSDVGWTSPCSPDTCQTSEANTSPLRMRIRRLPNVSPVPEFYNIIGQDAESGSTPSTPCGISARFV